jgi:hypothetical protein
MRFKSSMDIDPDKRSAVDEFQKLCDRIAERAQLRGLTDEKLAQMLADDD